MDNYKIIKFLNKGSYGKIYLVEQLNSKKLYALKSIQIQGINRYNKVCILNEIKILLINNSDFLLKCYDLFIHKKKLCIITEYINGGDLEQYVKNNKIKSEQDIIKIFLKICVGINSLHINNIIHRDIKPANILITNNGDIKICDFGISKVLEFNKVTNTQIGTPFFMSPEQMVSQYYDYKIDVWGIGCVLYYLLYNKYPFHGNTMIQLKKNIQYHNPFLNQKSKYKSNKNDFHIEHILKEMFEKNKQKRLDLTMFLDNNTKLLDFYNIHNSQKKYGKYKIKFVPNNNKEWEHILHIFKTDFHLNTTMSDEPLKDTSKDSVKTYEQPKIITFTEVKNKKYKIKPIIHDKKIPIIHNKKKPLSNKTKIYTNKKQSLYDKTKVYISPPLYKIPKPHPKIYIHNSDNPYIETLQRLRIQNSIDDRKKRIKEHQRYIEDQREKARYRIQQYKKQKKNPSIAQIHYNLDKLMLDMKERIKKAESKVKHIWAKKT